ncbi:MAG: MBL fold metallo-hydrolase [Firmicutes bacterium]|nr:MBL fold metallo-hydrolase [Bacillota bacterium]
MQVTYIYHSCFLVETAECYYLFDYYKGELPVLDTEKPLLVFVSHSHQDHYDPAVFAMLLSMGMKQVCAILPNDIKRRSYPEGWDTDSEANSDIRSCTDINSLYGHVLKVYHSREYDLPCHTHIRTLLSTDSGVAFLLTCPEGTFYHAGDLNDWITEDTPDGERRQMTGSFRAALRPLTGFSIDCAFLPLDPHLGCHYADGFLYFLRHIGAKKVYPMHFWDKPEIIEQFLREYPEYKEIVISHSK